MERVDQLQRVTTPGDMVIRLPPKFLKFAQSGLEYYTEHGGELKKVCVGDGNKHCSAGSFGSIKDHMKVRGGSSLADPFGSLVHSTSGGNSCPSASSIPSWSP